MGKSSNELPEEVINKGIGDCCQISCNKLNAFSSIKRKWFPLNILRSVIFSINIVQSG